MKWSNQDFDPPWNFRGNPAEVISLIRSGWLPRAGRVLDIGCGEGDLACWFAKQGYMSTGIDIAPAAISRARTRHKDCGKVRYEVLDICAAVPSGGPFDIVIDRGCLHILQPRMIYRYRANLAAACKPGAKMLIFTKDGRQQKVSALTQSRWPLFRLGERILKGQGIGRTAHSLFKIERESQTDLRGSEDHEFISGVLYQLHRTSRMR